MLISLFLAVLAGFIVTYIILPPGIRYLRKIGMNVVDMAKPDQRLVPISGGVIVMCGLFIALLAYIFLKTFYFKDDSSTTIILASLSSIMMITLIGLLDDLLIRKVSADIYVGLQRWQKPLLTIPAAIPLMVIKAGNSTMVLPYFGTVDFGMFYPLLLVPIGVVGAANMVNLLEGFNGIASGMGLIYSFSLGLYAYTNGRLEAAILAFALFGTLLAFFRFNFVPAKVFPGDSLTYLLGGSMACIAIIGNIEKAAIIASIPFIIEFLLKARSKFQAQTYGIALSNGKIMSKYDKIYSLPHLMTITGRYSEKQIVLAMMAIELVFCLLIWVI